MHAEVSVAPLTSRPIDKTPPNEVVVKKITNIRRVSPVNLISVPLVLGPLHSIRRQITAMLTTRRRDGVKGFRFLIGADYVAKFVDDRFTPFSIREIVTFQLRVPVQKATTASGRGPRPRRKSQSGTHLF